MPRSGTLHIAKTPETDDSVSAADRVATAIVAALEQQQMVPGQRLVETALAAQFGVGRNAVREAVQRLAAKGIVDLSRNRSPAIRRLDVKEALEVLEVAEAMVSLLARLAAQNFTKRAHCEKLKAVMRKLDSTDTIGFNRARRRFYRTLLDIGANRELDRLFSTIHMQILYAQYQSPRLYEIRRTDYATLAEAVMTGDGKAAETIVRRHVKRVREIVLEIAGTQTPEAFH